MKLLAFLPVTLALACLLSSPSPAAQINLATLSCDKYENEIVGTADAPDSASEAAPRGPVQASTAPSRPDAINTVMWLFGFSVAKAADHVMYGDALASFGFALDAECKNNPRMNLLQAVATVRPKRDKPMDLASLNCGTFETRHAESARTDPESAKTIMMWLFGFSVGLSGNHVLDTDGVERFAAALQTQCTRNPNDSLFDVLSGVSHPGQR
ncbi:MAG: HdeA/HdeB family chaperone [Steroidobacteraceae bacterium]|jgi:hypothetical protein